MPKTFDPLAAALPTHVKLLDHWGEYHAGKVLRVDADRLAQLDVEGARYVPATEADRRLGGFPD